MGRVRFHKVVSALPSQLEKDGLYLVRTGEGFDLYASDSTGAIAHKVNTGAADQNTQTNTDLLDYEGRKNGSVSPLFGTTLISKDPLRLRPHTNGQGFFDAEFLRASAPSGGWKAGHPYTLSVLVDAAVYSVGVANSSSIQPKPQFNTTPLGDFTLYTTTFTWPAGVGYFSTPLEFRATNPDVVMFHGFKLEEGGQSTLLTPARFTELSIRYLHSQIAFDTGWRDVSGVLQGFEAWRDRNNVQQPRYLFAEKRGRVLVRRIGNRAFICLDFQMALNSTQPGGVYTIGQLPGAFMPEVRTILQYVPSTGAPDTSAQFGLTPNGQVFYVNRGNVRAEPTPTVIEYRLKYPHHSVHPLPGVPAQTRGS